MLGNTLFVALPGLTNYSESCKVHQKEQIQQLTQAGYKPEQINIVHVV